MALYSHLAGSKQQFRLIRFVGKYPERTWELATFSIHDEISWLALSYCWGKSEATETVTVNGEDFPVRPNLFTFLDQMAFEDRKNWYFVDAICIHQEDMAERASQVSLMGQIYQEAEEVVVWIDLGLQPLLCQDNIEPLRKMAADKDLTSERRRCLTAILDGVKSLIRYNDYWSRPWIVQEVLLARVLTIRWLSFTFHWADILGEDHASTARLDPNGRPRPSETLVSLLDEGSSVSNQRGNSFSCDQLCHWKKFVGTDLQDGKMLDFHQAVLFFGTQNCSHMSDRVFGLLGIARSYIQPDYHTSIAELYTATLYNSLLSLWCQRSTKSTSPAQEFDQSEVFEALGLDGLHWKAAGEVLFYAFKLEPFESLTCLITHEVLGRFMPGRELLGLRKLAANWLLSTSYQRLRVSPRGKIKVSCKKKWYDTKQRANQRYEWDLERRSVETLTRVQAAKEADEILKGPSHSPQSMSCSAWVALIHAICDDIWTRASADMASWAGSSVHR